MLKRNLFVFFLLLGFHWNSMIGCTKPTTPANAAAPIFVALIPSNHQISKAESSNGVAQHATSTVNQPFDYNNQLQYPIQQSSPDYSQQQQYSHSQSLPNDYSSADYASAPPAYSQATQVPSFYPNLNVFIVTTSHNPIAGKAPEQAYKSEGETIDQPALSPCDQYNKAQSGGGVSQITNQISEYTEPKSEPKYEPKIESNNNYNNNDNNILRVMLLNPPLMDNHHTSQYPVIRQGPPPMSYSQGSQKSYAREVEYAPESYSHETEYDDDEHEREYEERKYRENFSSKRTYPKSTYQSPAPQYQPPEPKYEPVPEKPKEPEYSPPVPQKAAEQAYSPPAPKVVETAKPPVPAYHQPQPFYFPQMPYEYPEYPEYSEHSSHKSKQGKGRYSIRIKSPFGILNKILDKLFEGKK